MPKTTESQPIDLGAATGTVLNERVIVVRGKQGVEINRDTAGHILTLIDQIMPGEFGMILDRQADYSVAPVEVFELLNNTPRLKVVAIVAHRPATAGMAQIEQHLFNGRLEIFIALDLAEAWVNSVLPPDS